MDGIIALAIPFFFVLLLLELLMARHERRRLHRVNDSITDLSCGVGDQVLSVMTKSLTLVPYAWLHERYSLVDLTGRPLLMWLLALVGVDFTYYWYHRFSHRVNFAWATHVVHHQSEEYNLAVALRQSWFAKVYHWVFDLPLALLGVPTPVYAAATSVNLLYQFWIHTRTIRTMGPFEWLFNTPSHHRVHHGCNERYLDRNYAGILVVWDRLFGTFRLEEGEPVYGTVKPLASWNPAWANVGPFVMLWRQARAASRWRDKLYVWIAPPEWLPSNLPASPMPTDEELARRALYDADAPRGYHAYVRAQFVVLALATMGMLLMGDHLPAPVTAATVTWILTTLVAWGGIFEGRSWALPLEAARVAALGVAGLVALASGLTTWGAAGAVLSVGSALWLGSLRGTRSEAVAVARG